MTDDRSRDRDRIERIERRIERLEGKLDERAAGGGGTLPSPTRRQMLGAIGAGGVLAAAGGSASGAPGDGDLGNARFVGAGESLQRAIDESRLVFLTSSYDPSAEADYAGNDDPDTITIDREVTIVGDGVTEITAGSDGKPAVEIVTRNTRPNEVSLRNLTISGGSPGLRIEDTGFVELTNVNVDGATGHGLQIHDSAADATPNSINMYNTTIEDSAADGIHVDGGAHSMNLFGVRTIGAGRHGANISRRRNAEGNPTGPANFTVTMVGCQFEDSQGYGLRTQGVHGGYVYGLYLEGNKKDPGAGGADADVYARNCTQFVLEGAYAYVNDEDVESRKSLLYVEDCHTVNVRATRAKKKYEYLVDGSGPGEGAGQTAQLDCYRSSHYPGAGGIVSDNDVARRLRSNGVLLSPDLDAIAGSHAGEIGIHDYDGRPKVFVWDDGEEDKEWVSADGEAKNT